MAIQSGNITQFLNMQPALDVSDIEKSIRNLSKARVAGDWAQQAYDQLEDYYEDLKDDMDDGPWYQQILGFAIEVGLNWLVPGLGTVLVNAYEYNEDLTAYENYEANLNQLYQQYQGTFLEDWVGGAKDTLSDIKESIDISNALGLGASFLMPQLSKAAVSAIPDAFKDKFFGEVAGEAAGEVAEEAAGEVAEEGFEKVVEKGVEDITLDAAVTTAVEGGKSLYEQATGEAIDTFTEMNILGSDLEGATSDELLEAGIESFNPSTGAVELVDDWDERFAFGQTAAGPADYVNELSDPYEYLDDLVSAEEVGDPSALENIMYNVGQDLSHTVKPTLDLVEEFTDPSYFEGIGKEFGWGATSPVEALLPPWAENMVGDNMFLDLLSQYSAPYLFQKYGVPIMSGQMGPQTGYQFNPRTPQQAAMQGRYMQLPGFRQQYGQRPQINPQLLRSIYG